jgi:flagellar biosynthesis/type III secretory pathway M-ring protein FliF/YscJ
METIEITKVYIFIALFSLILLVLQISIVQAIRTNTLEEQVTQQQTSDYAGYFVVFIIIVIIIGAISRKVKKRRKEKRRERHGFPDSVKEDVLRKQNHRCVYCNRVLNVVDWHHKNGDRSNNKESNCQALCPNCHADITRRRKA